MGAGNPASACSYVEVESKKKKGRPRNDFRKMKLEPELDQEHEAWRRAILRPGPTHASMETDVKQ